MHLFLTGAVGCGKSTVIDKVLARQPLPVGGFRTGFGSDRGEVERALYLWSAASQPLRDEEHVVARFDSRGAAPRPARFDALGVAALNCPWAGLIVMDECGRLEREALRFQAVILAKLNGVVPVLGVVRQGFPGWTRAIVEHPDVEIIEVTAQNREELVPYVSGRIDFSR